jgi:xanthine dehydrogenase YagR molybdenum-binding subunit
MSILDDAKQAVQGAVQGVMQKAIQLAPDSFMPGGRPDPLIRAQHGHIGKPISRLDGPVKVRGEATYAAEFPLDGMLYAALVFSTIAKGRIASLDTDAAEAASGVELVMTYRNAPRMASMPLFMTSEKACGGNDLPIMQDDRIYWNGEPVALVLAETQEQADHAASLIAVTYDADHSITAMAKTVVTSIIRFAMKLLAHARTWCNGGNSVVNTMPHRSRRPEQNCRTAELPNIHEVIGNLLVEFTAGRPGCWR